ncbi:MAG: gamma-glutamylcyclotransferase [Actinobacteria bacterium]|nr:gamma-glutamylcyclotransferase [Actinomycetota bacterium]
MKGIGKGHGEIVYFAYGSNMPESRMRERTPSAVALVVWKLEGMRVAMNKKGWNDSEKANLVEDPGSVVYSTLYRIDSSELPRLDSAEGGYERRSFKAVFGDEIVEAQVYISREITEAPVAWDWYKDIILKGAKEHGLPGSYIQYLESLPSKPCSENSNGQRLSGEYRGG